MPAPENANNAKINHEKKEEDDKKVTKDDEALKKLKLRMKPKLKQQRRTRNHTLDTAKILK